MNEHTRSICLKKQTNKTLTPAVRESPLPRSSLEAHPIKIHKRCICVVVVVVGGDKSAALNNLPAQRRRREMRDLKVRHSRWEQLFIYFSTVPPPLFPPAVSILVVHPGRHSVRDERH